MNKRVEISREMIVDNVTYDDVCGYVDSVLTERVDSRPHFIFAQNPFKVAMSSKQPELLRALEHADILIPDGIGIIISAMLNGIRLKERVTGVDLMQRLVSLADRKGYRVYFLGGEPGVAETAAIKLKAEYPQLKVAGTADGYFSKEDEVAVIERINDADPDILFVCMGSPKQELFLYRNRGRISVPICMGGGGSLDVYAGNAKRAPRAIQRIGLEWAYRLCKDPKRFKRYASGYFRYLLLILKGLVFKSEELSHR